MQKKQEENSQDYYNSIMTKKLAKRIIELREVEEYSWRAMCNKVSEEFENLVLNPGNQIDGMYLEYSAIEFLESKKEKNVKKDNSKDN